MGMTAVSRRQAGACCNCTVISQQYSPQIVSVHLAHRTPPEGQREGHGRGQHARRWTDVVLMGSEGRMHQYKGLNITPYTRTHLQKELAPRERIQA